MLKKIVHALKNEPLSVILSNVKNRILKRDDLYRVRQFNSTKFQIIKIYQTPVYLEIIGWAYDEKKNISEVNLLLDASHMKASTYLAPGISKLHGFKSDKIGFSFSIDQKQNRYGKLQLIIQYDNGSASIHDIEIPDPSYPSKEELGAIISPPLKMEKLSYDIDQKVAIIIPFRDGYELLKGLIDKLLSCWLPPQLEILLLDNQSTEEEMVHYLGNITKEHPAIRTIKMDYDFNFSRIMNDGVSYTDAAYIVLLNNDIMPTNDDWLFDLLSVASIDDIGVVGPKLVYPDNTIQHIGIVLSSNQPLYVWKKYPNDPSNQLLFERRAYSAITGACMVMKRSLFVKAGGFDEHLPVTLNDVDFCLQVGLHGKKIVVSATTTMIHYESLTRGAFDAASNFDRTTKEQTYFRRKWKKWLKKGDPYYSQKLSHRYPDYRYNS